MHMVNHLNLGLCEESSEVSHQPTRQQERAMLGFTSPTSSPTHYLLRQGQHRKDHRLPVSKSSVIRPTLGQESHATHEKSHPDNVLPHAMGKDVFLLWSWRSIRIIPILCFEP
jgi:hypothetical protein